MTGLEVGVTEGVLVGVDVDEVDDSTTGVQFGRVNVGELPEPPSTMQFFAQAASPEVVEVCQQVAPLTP